MVQLTSVNVNLANMMVDTTLSKLQDSKVRLNKIKAALNEAKTQRDEQVGMLRGASKVLARLAKDKEELMMHKSGLVPNEEVVQKLEAVIKARKETLRDLGMPKDAIESASLDATNLDKAVSDLQSDYEVVSLDVEENDAKLKFTEGLLKLLKDNRIPMLSCTPPKQVWSSRSIFVSGDCVACGLSIVQDDVVGVYMLPCNHPYHPICFSIACKSSNECLYMGCSQSFNNAAHRNMSSTVDREGMPKEDSISDVDTPKPAFASSTLYSWWLENVI